MNKQIEEMAKALYEDCGNCEDCPWCGKGNEDMDCISLFIADKFYNKGYRKSTDVAREIFEEIEKILALHLIPAHIRGVEDVPDYYKGNLAHDIAELKKKYESEGADDDKL